MTAMRPGPAARPVVLLDLDGTLVDSASDLASAVDAMLAEEGLPPLGEAVVRTLIGDGAAELVRRAHAARAVAEPAGALDRFRHLYGERCLVGTTVYPGVPALLSDLAASGRRLAVVTNKPTAFSERILEGLGLAPLLDAVVGPELAPARKPSPEHVITALALLGARPEDAVMVGDGPTDVLAGRGAGTATIGVLWGYRTSAELEAAGVDWLARTIDELRALVT